MAEVFSTISKGTESTIFYVFEVFLKITQTNITVSAGVVCSDKRKFSIVCYTSQRLTEAQVNSITYFLNNNLEIIKYRLCLEYLSKFAKKVSEVLVLAF